MKKSLRILTAIVLFIPSYPFIVACFSMFGFLFIIPICSLFLAPYYWLIGDRMEQGFAVEDIFLFVAIPLSPLAFWDDFIQGRRPFSDTNI